jgi:hypothetical protein
MLIFLTFNAVLSPKSKKFKSELFQNDQNFEFQQFFNYNNYRQLELIYICTAAHKFTVTMIQHIYGLRVLPA